MTIHERFPFSWKVDDMRKQKVDEKERNEVLNQGIEVLELSTRCYNSLKRNAINSIGEVIAKWDCVPKLRSFGVHCKGELKGKMIAYLIANKREDLVESLLNVVSEAV